MPVSNFRFLDRPVCAVRAAASSPFPTFSRICLGNVVFYSFFMDPEGADLSLAPNYTNDKITTAMVPPNHVGADNTLSYHQEIDILPVEHFS